MIASTPEMLVVLIDEKKPKILIKYAESQETTYVVDDYNKDFDSETFVFAAGSVAIFRTVDEDFIEQFYVLAGSGATPLYSRKSQSSGACSTSYTTGPSGRYLTSFRRA